MRTTWRFEFPNAVALSCNQTDRVKFTLFITGIHSEKSFSKALSLLCINRYQNRDCLLHMANTCRELSFPGTHALLYINEIQNRTTRYGHSQAKNNSQELTLFDITVTEQIFIF